MKALPITAIVLTYNSARTLESVLKSLTWCGQILIVDSGSTDETLKIAEECGAIIKKRKFTGFGDQKNFAVSSAEYDWVFVVDSDEVVSPELSREIREAFQEPDPEVSGFYIPIRLFFLGSKMAYGGNTVKHALRLFDRRNGNFNLALVHELVELQGRRKFLKNTVSHYSYLTIDDYFEKFNRYTTFGAQELYRMGKKPIMLKVWLGLPVYFMKMYVFKGGILDGYHGFLWCLLSSFYPVVKYAKLRELQRQGRALPAMVFE